MPWRTAPVGSSPVSPDMSRARYPIEGRTALVTGAARGIGAETAARLHARGANVALVGLERDRLEGLAARLGERATWVEADVADTDALERAVSHTRDRFGGIDVAIANAGIYFVGALATSPREQVERALEVNLLGVWRTNRAVLPHVVERRGYLLNVASLAAASHTPLMGPYAASKAGVEALTNSLRTELAATGARVGCAYFGFIDTDLVRRGLADPAAVALQKVIPPALRRAVPLERAVDAIERGVERRARRVWAPSYVGALLALREPWQLLLEQRVRRAPELREALRLADPTLGARAAVHPLLGVAGEVEGERPNDPTPADPPAAERSEQLV
jgi:NAD(P)-dependent dehydrogenase (short-subunit alcohol dehydrogenase family)